jgi:hypothetical protein
MKIIVVDTIDEVLKNALSKKLEWGVRHRNKIGGFFSDSQPKQAN